MVEYKILLTEEERFNLVAEEYFEAVEYEDWEKVASLIKLNPDIMAEGLELVYRRLPDQYKYSIPTSCYTHNGDRMPIVRKYVRQARKYAQIEERIPAEMIGLPEIEIYRAGAEPLDKVICSLKGRQGNSKREREERWENGSKWIYRKRKNSSRSALRGG